MIIGFMTFLPGESSSRPCSGALILSLAACFGPTSHCPPPPCRILPLPHSVLHLAWPQGVQIR